MALSSRACQTIGVGQSIYACGQEGAAWRVSSGVVRLDVGTPINSRFASLAVAGDIIGCESLLLGCYSFSASALTHCELTPWPEGVPSGNALIESLAHAQQRAVELVALRGGQAMQRVLGLMRLLSDAAGNVVLPTRQDIADITDLRFETVSRIIKKMESEQIISPSRVSGVHATRSFKFNREFCVA